jgi:hypothetical protein
MANFETRIYLKKIDQGKKIFAPSDSVNYLVRHSIKFIIIIFF